MMNKLMLIFGLMLIPLQGYAASAWVEINLTAIRTGISSGNHFVYFDPIDANTDPNNCGLLNEASYPTSGDFKVVHATALAALLADKTLIVKFSGCNGSRPEISFVEIQK